MPRKRGRELILLINGNLTACAVDYTLDTVTEPLPVNSQTSSTWLSYRPNFQEWSLRASYIYDTDTDNFQEIFALKTAQTVFTVQMKDVSDVGFFYESSGFITSLSHGAAEDRAAGFNFSMIGTEELVSDFFFLFLVDENGDQLVDESGNSLIG